MDSFSPSKTDLARLQGETFEVGGDSATTRLRLLVVEDLDNSPRPGGGFRLDFVGPAGEEALPQAIYRFAHDDGAWDIFVVPVGRDGDAIRYEAVFN